VPSSRNSTFNYNLLRVLSCSSDQARTVVSILFYQLQDLIGQLVGGSSMSSSPKFRHTRLAAREKRTKPRGHYVIGTSSPSPRSSAYGHYVIGTSSPSPLICVHTYGRYVRTYIHALLDAGFRILQADYFFSHCAKEVGLALECHEMVVLHRTGTN
jgi:hypothetical protein